jgi:hypothetical protein
VISFAVGLIVGASIMALLFIIFAPSRRVRAESKPLDRDVETKLLLGEDPDDPTFPPAPSVDHPQPYSPNDLAQLRKLGEKSRRRR